MYFDPCIKQFDAELLSKNIIEYTLCSAPGAGEGTSTGDLPHPPRKKRARVDPTVESVCHFRPLFKTKSCIVLQFVL